MDCIHGSECAHTLREVRTGFVCLGTPPNSSTSSRVSVVACNVAVSPGTKIYSTCLLSASMRKHGCTSNMPFPYRHFMGTRFPGHLTIIHFHGGVCNATRIGFGRVGWQQNCNAVKKSCYKRHRLGSIIRCQNSHKNCGRYVF